jgi:Excalibur calcium-binding domain
MKNKKAQFILHKISLIAFVSACVLSTAASCSSNAADNKNEKTLQSSSSAVSSSIKQETSIQSKTSLTNKIKDKLSEADKNQKSESGTLDQRISENFKNEDNTIPKEQEKITEKAIEIQTNIEPIPKIIETQKPTIVENQPIFEKKTETPTYITPKIVEQQTITPTISQTPPKEIITPSVNRSIQNVISTSTKLTCKDIGHKVYIGNPDYLPKLDRDGDGVGCEAY